MATWEAIERAEDEQITDDLPQTEEASFWGEVRPGSRGQWRWRIMATDASLDQWPVDSGVADSEEKAKVEVEHWQPLSRVRKGRTWGRSDLAARGRTWVSRKLLPVGTESAGSQILR